MDGVSVYTHFLFSSRPWKNPGRGPVLDSEQKSLVSVFFLMDEVGDIESPLRPPRPITPGQNEEAMIGVGGKRSGTGSFSFASAFIINEEAA